MKTVSSYSKEMQFKFDIFCFVYSILGFIIVMTLLFTCGVVYSFVATIVLFTPMLIIVNIFYDKLLIQEELLTQCSKFKDIKLKTVDFNCYQYLNSVDIIINNEIVTIHRIDILDVEKKDIPDKSFVYLQKYKGKDYISCFVPGKDFYELKDKVRRDIYNADI